MKVFIWVKVKEKIFKIHSQLLKRHRLLRFRKYRLGLAVSRWTLYYRSFYTLLIKLYRVTDLRF